MQSNFEVSRIDSLIHSAASFFEIGIIDEIDDHPLGGSNASYVIRMQSGDKYVVRIFKRFDANIFANELHIQKKLREHAIRSNYTLQARNGDYLCRVGDECLSISKYIAGAHPIDPTVHTCYEIGALLGIFHGIMTDLPFTNTRMLLNPVNVESNIPNIKVKAFQEKLSYLFNYSKSLFEFELPRGGIHGDLHAGNVLVNGDAISLLDMESSGESILLLDVTRSIIDICREDDHLNKIKLKNFVKGYTSERELANSELIQFNRAIVYCSAAVASWFCVRKEDYKFAESFMRVGFAATSEERLV